MSYKCISADSHLEIRPGRYAERVPAKYRDRASKVITLEAGTLAVLQEGQPLERPRKVSGGNAAIYKHP